MTGSELADARQDIGWSQSELGRRLGCSPQFVSALERSMRPVPPWIAVRVLAMREAVMAVAREWLA
jgi:transcriptional regulator with XRE-family HTH domain